MSTAVGVAVCGLTVACGSSGGSDANPPNPSASGASLIPTAPACQLGQTLITGTIDGTPIHDLPDPAYDFEATQIGAGVANGTSSLLIGIQSDFVRGMKTPIADGFYYIEVMHPLMGKYLCLTAGEIGPVADASKLIPGAPPKDVLLQFHVSAAKLGTKAFDCSGADVPIALDGCVDLDSARFLP